MNFCLLEDLFGSLEEVHDHLSDFFSKINILPYWQILFNTIINKIANRYESFLKKCMEKSAFQHIHKSNFLIFDGIGLLLKVNKGENKDYTTMDHDSTTENASAFTRDLIVFATFDGCCGDSCYVWFGNDSSPKPQYFRSIGTHTAKNRSFFKQFGCW